MRNLDGSCLYWTQNHNILFTVLLHGKKKKDMFSHLWILWKLLQYLQVFILISLQWQESITQYSLFFKIRLCFYFTCWKLWTFTKRQKQGQAHTISCTSSSSHLSLHTWNFSHKRREKECKPAFSILDFPLKNLFKVHLFVKDWKEGSTLQNLCREDSVNSEADFFPAETTRKSKVQHHMQAAFRALFCLSLSRFTGPNDLQ